MVYQGEQVYRTPTHNALGSRILIDQITPHLSKENEEVNAHVKDLQPMLDTVTVADPVHDQEDKDRGHKDDHRHSPHGDLASNITPPEERGRGNGRDNCDFRNIICDRDAHSRIENRHRDHECDEQE
jgi:hypothetical protein